MVLRRILGPSLETGAVLDAALSVNYCAIAIRVSVMLVGEKCDEKGGALGSENPMRETPVESHPFRKVREKYGHPAGARGNENKKRKSRYNPSRPAAASRSPTANGIPHAVNVDSAGDGPAGIIKRQRVKSLLGKQ
jgi:hypothetical protein